MAIRLRHGGRSGLPINGLKRDGQGAEDRRSVQARTDDVGLRSRQSPVGLIIYPCLMDEVSSIGIRDFNTPRGPPQASSLDLTKRLVDRWNDLVSPELNLA